MRSLHQYLLAAITLLAASSVNGQTIHTSAGAASTCGYSGDGGPATSARINTPQGLRCDAASDLYIADADNQCVRMVNAAGVITTIAGTGTFGFSGDGGPASAARLNAPQDVAIDAAGNIYIDDYANNRIRKINTSGIISTVCGTGAAGFSGDGGPATAATIHQPHGVAVDRIGNLYIADVYNNRIRKVDTFGIITTIAGSSIAGGYWGDGGPATAAELNAPFEVAVDTTGNVYIADIDNYRIRKVDTFGIITTFAGTGTHGFTGDGGPATAAEIYNPEGLAFDISGNLFFSDEANGRIRKISPSGIITTYAGGGSITTDGCLATSAAVDPGYLATYGTTIYYSEQTIGCMVRRIDTGSITVAPITGTFSLCTGSPETLSDATAGGTWSSSTPSVATIGSASGVVTGVASGTAVITYDVYGVVATATVTVNVSPTISASASYDTCGGQYFLLATGTCTSYTWSPATGLSCATCSSATIVPSGTTVYTVTGTDGICPVTTTVSADGNRIAGHIFPTLTTGSAPVVWLIQFNPTDSVITAVDSTETCLTSGFTYYEFRDKPAGNYLIKAYQPGGTPGSSGYMATYSLSSAHWDSAATITHLATNRDTADVDLIYGTVPSGLGFISGYVVSGAGRGTSGDVPLANALIYLEDASGRLLTYVQTDATGAYSFTGLGNGSYIVYPEVYKYYTTPSATIVLTSSSDHASGIDFKQHTTYGTITPTVIPSGVVQVNAYPTISVYPNPVSDEVVISGLQHESNYRLMNAIGVEVGHGVLSGSGYHLSMAHLASGVYILELTDGGQSSIIRLVKE